MGSSAGRRPPSPSMVHTWAMAGGATIPSNPAALAAASSTYTGLVSPRASTQLLIIGWFTGSRPSRGALAPAAMIFSAAAVISSGVLVSGKELLLSDSGWGTGSGRTRSTWNPGQFQARGGEEFAHDLVDAATEGHHQVLFGAPVEPAQQFRGRRIGRVAEAAHDLFGQPAGFLQRFGGEDLGRRSIGDDLRLIGVRILRGRRDLPVQQFVEPGHGVDTAQRALRFGFVED